MGMNRKAVFFTIIAIMLMTILAVAFTPQENVSYKDRLPAINARVGISNDYVKRLKLSFVPAAVETSGKDAMAAMSLFVNKSAYFPNQESINTTFSELMLNGSINGTPVECFLDNKPRSASACIPLLSPNYRVMRGKSFLDKAEAMENASRDSLYIKTAFPRSLSDYRVRIFQTNDTGPWRIGVNMSLNYSVDAEISYWNVSQNLEASFNIIGVPDPLFMGGFAGYRNPIIPTNVTVWSTRENFTSFLANQRYRASSEAPSFLMRLGGNFSTGGPSPSGSVCCGIESAVHPNKVSAHLTSMGRPAIHPCTQKSYIDWCLSSNNCIPNIPGGGKLWNLTGITSYVAGIDYYGFKIDTDNAKDYNVTAWTESYLGNFNC